MVEHYAVAPMPVKRIIMETPHGLFIEDSTGVYWMIPKRNVLPSRVVVPVCNCLDTWFH